MESSQKKEYASLVVVNEEGVFGIRDLMEAAAEIIKGIAQDLRFLHSHFSSYDLPHGNLKSSNVLLTQDYETLLSDYALHPLLNPNSFPLFAFKSPDYVEHQLISQKADVYCLGIIILEIITGKLPSQYHSNDEDNTTDVVNPEQRINLSEVIRRIEEVQV
ncbi:hypothetical protein K1719_005691 [Acacia pycnantha]|nr:hypothetical protein K1719_005691 [Acacia pycnantha]